ncbi:unnamed protein product [Enterobius vermicularis]|uniref:Multidrug resistance-associated protein 1 n=1 Tax=Enterobius vermicularis TaxID=51028 RepID=A0A0N4V3C6_ENTVE|nr:unnamed protein product [Enterobius vermicularis]
MDSIARALCNQNTFQLFDKTLNSSFPHLSECVQESILILTPCIFLFIFAPLVLFSLYKSDNGPLEAFSPITGRIVICVFLSCYGGYQLFFGAFGHQIGPDFHNLNLVSATAQYLAFCIVLIMLFASKKRGLVTSGVLFNFWLLMAICRFPEFRWRLSRFLYIEENDRQWVPFVLFMIAYPLILLELLLSCFADTPAYKVTDRQMCPEESCSFLNQITFNWFNGLAFKGSRRSLQISDLWKLKTQDQSKVLVPQFNKHWLPSLKAYYERRRPTSGGALLQVPDEKSLPSVIWPLFKTFRWSFISGALLKLVFDLLQFVSPQLLKMLISFIEDKSSPMWVGISISLFMFFVALFQSLALSLSNSARKNRTVGEIVNLMSVDTQRFQDMTSFVLLFGSAPLQVLLSIYFLWRLLGVAVFAGLFVLTGLIPLNALLAYKMRTAQVEQMKHKDERLKLMSEILNGIKVLKFYAWEKSMQKMVMITVTLSWSCAPFLVTVITFGVYVNISASNVLTPQVTFVGLALFNILRFPMAIFSMLFGQAIQCAVSNKRIKSFLAEDEIGKFVIEGSEMDKLEGEVCVSGSVAYVSQQAWIQNMSLKDNIIFDRPFDADNYKRIIEACALKADIAALPAGDQTEIGEKGINLSGGQKQRISLARAVYASSDIVLLDDPLSAVDAHVGKHIFEKIISSKTGLLAKKTRVLVTHALHYLKYCDQIIVMKDGTISECGKYEELMSSEGAFAEFLEEYLVEEAKNRGRSVSFGEQEEEVNEVLKDLERFDPIRRRRFERHISQATYSSQESLESKNISSSIAKSPDLSTARLSNGDAAVEKAVPKVGSEKGDRYEIEPLLRKEKSKPASSSDDNKSKLIEKELVEIGRVKWSVYVAYIKAIGYLITCLFVIIYILSSVLGVISNLWLADWSDHAKYRNASSENDDTNMRLGVYASLGVGQGNQFPS